jgi:type IV secretory pathway VirB2 component (pilin)
MVATPDWLAIVDDEINLWLTPSVLAQIDRDTQGVDTSNEIIYRVNSQELLQVLASSVGMAAQRQGAIAIWTYYNDQVRDLPDAKPSPILRTLIHIDGDLSQKVAQDLLKHPQADRIVKAHSFLVSQISRQFITAIADYIEAKLRPFAIATVSFTTTITWCEPLQNLGKRLHLPESFSSFLTSQCWHMAIAAPIVVLIIWWISSKLNLKWPTLPKSSQKFFEKLLQLLESPIFRFVAIIVVIALILGWIAIKFVIPIDKQANSLIVMVESYLEPYLPIAIISLRQWIVSGLGKIFLRYPFFVKLIFGRFVR